MREVQIIADAETWERMRGEPQFIELIRLARIANSLTLAYPPIFIPQSDQSPRARRTRFAGLFYSAALLKEALHTVRSLGKWYREKAQYREGVGAILADPKVTAFESEIASKRDDSAWLCFVSGQMIPAESAIHAEAVRLLALAQAHGGEYDGWEAAIVK